MKSKHLILFLLLPLSEIKSIFYNSDLKADWYLFSDNKRFLCNVLEDYSNIVIIGIILYFYLFTKRDIVSRQIVFFLFILNGLDLLFLGMMDNQLYLLKLPISLIIYTYALCKIRLQLLKLYWILPLEFFDFEFFRTDFK